MQSSSLFDLIGEERLRALVEAFYLRVGQHPDLAPIFPPDLRETAEKQYMFLTQFFGGPSLYSDVYGHPMLRARHMPFPITVTRARAWLSCMVAAMDEVAITGDLREQMLAKLAFTAQHMVNRQEE